MYPYFDYHGVTIYTMGIGIMISTMVFLVHVWYSVKKNKLPFTKFFFWIPTLLVSMYFLGNWAGLIFEKGIVFPFRSLQTIGALISPYGFHFHFIGLMIGAIFAWRRFFKKIYLKSEVYKWVDVLFFATAAALVPLGFFLLMGDTFIGKPTDAWYGVIALLNDSQWTNFGRVFPLGILVSIFSVVIYSGIFLAKKITPQNKVWGYLGFGLLSLGFFFVFIGQHYTRHLVIPLGSYSLDSKNILALIIALYFIVAFIRHPKKIA